MDLPSEELKFPKYEVPTTEQLVQAQAHIWNHMFFFINSMSLNSAMQLGIPHIIHTHGKPMTLSQLVDALDIDKTKSQCVYRLMRILTYSKFFTTINAPMAKIEGGEEEEAEFYWLTPASRLLLQDGPLTLAPLVQLLLDPIMTRPTEYVSEWIVSGKHGSPFEEAHGRGIWELARLDSRFNQMFNQGMSCDARFIMHVILKESKQVFEGIQSVVDVGGGEGAAAKVILDTFPDMKCIVLDLPHVVGCLEEGKDNLTYIGGNMFDPTQAILLKFILHDWNDEDCIRILKKCKEAITNKGKGGGGKVIIIDTVMDALSGTSADEEVQPKLFLDMAMMAYMNGKERSEKEWAKLFSEAGFTSYNINSSLGVIRSIIEVYP